MGTTLHARTHRDAHKKQGASPASFGGNHRGGFLRGCPLGRGGSGSYCPGGGGRGNIHFNVWSSCLHGFADVVQGRIQFGKVGAAVLHVRCDFLCVCVCMHVYVLNVLGRESEILFYEMLSPPQQLPGTCSGYR